MSRTGLEYALHRVHHGENEVVQQLSRMADRHQQEAEVHHVATDLIGWSTINIARLADAAKAYDVSLSREPDSPGVVRHAVDSLVSATSVGTAPALALLEDLRDLYLVASETSLAWEMLAQHAQARRETDLLQVTSECHPQTLRQIRWANGMLKTLSPQALASLDT
jgi:hypothetical protein